MSEMGDLSVASFEEAVARIVVPESRIFSPSSTEFQEASITFTTLVDAYAGTVFQVHARPDGSSNAMEEDGSGTTLAIPTPSRRELKLRLPRPLDPVSVCPKRTFRVLTLPWRFATIAKLRGCSWISHSTSGCTLRNGSLSTLDRGRSPR